MLRRLPAPLILAIALAACSDRSPKADPDLERDLQLANQTPANPQFQDVPLGTAPQSQPTNPGPTQAVRTRANDVPQRRAPVAAPRRTTPPPTVVERTPEPETPAPAPARARRGFAAGTSFGLVTRGQVCTSNLPGDKFVAVTTSAVQGSNGAVIPEGTSVVLEVASVTPGNTPEDARIEFRVRSIMIDGESRPMDATVEPTSALERGPATQGNSDKKKVIGGAIAGAVLGQVLGRDTRSTVIGAAAGAAAGTAAAAATRKYHACLPAGGSLRVTTTQPLVLD